MKKTILFVLCFSVIILSLPSTSASAFQEISISGLGATQKVHAELIMPDGPGPFPAVLVLHTSGGVQKYDIEYAKQLAQEGYASLIPYYLNAYGITYDNRISAITVYADDILADFTSEIEYLQNQAKINNSKIGAVGFSMGGYWALILAGMNKVQAGVSYYGAMSGRGKDFDARYQFVNIFQSDSSPVLVLHGQDDTDIGVKNALRLGAMLKERSCVYEMQIYPNAGHRFDRGKSFEANAASDSWSRTIAFLGKYLQ